MDRPLERRKQNRQVLGKLRRSLPGLLLESVLITFGVLVAFAADSWKARAKLEQDTALVLKNLESELIGNRTMMLEWLGYYDSLVLRLNSEIEGEDDLSRIPDAQWVENLYPVPSVDYLPQATAWQTAQSTQVLRNFEYNTTYNLTHCYRYQKDIELTRDLVFETLHQSYIQAPAEFRIKALLALYRELIRKQQYLLGAYRDALVALDKELTSRIA